MGPLPRGPEYLPGLAQTSDSSHSIVIATHWDQEYTGYVCEREGLGAFLTLREVLAHRGRLRDVTAQTLADRAAYHARLLQVRDATFHTDGTKAAADHIEAFLRARAS